MRPVCMHVPLVLLILTLTACLSTPELEQSADPASASVVIGVATPLPERAVTNDIRAVPPFRVQGQVTTHVLPDDELRIDVVADTDQLDLRWQAAQGSCALWTRPSTPSTGNSRDLGLRAIRPPFSLAISTPGSSRGRFIDVFRVPRGAEPPYVLFAYIEGGGDIVACADLGIGSTPSATPQPKQP